MVDGIGVPKAHAHLIQSLQGDSPSTEYYLAPEHLMVDAASDMRSDLFLLGALLFRMVTAEGLITGFNAVEALHRFSATGTTTVAEFASMMPREMLSLLGRPATDRRDRFQQYGEAIEPSRGSSASCGDAAAQPTPVPRAPVANAISGNYLAPPSPRRGR